ncbi:MULTISPECIES: flagellin [Ponticaulis]|uniref:flagellin n=1 Tax=Ponticaulis TaxID=1123044 RepID=UPI0003B7B30A|nr:MULTISPECIES: flagellin [Ponticaulis]MAJ09922.1 flagellin [Ponticaulis sp.]RPG18532.1 MAG: flagellin [Hyphomonadaceae bacterium TMED125]HBH89735.1 flagellin [Hyphomonadaceae bacterium]HBJ94871.1 flagellin [Hyphomonadaceae bacterium]|tara:strand:- start:7190 stop:8014 length:825 start_codon:yes stop_codon:yes gene_type:complete
MASVNTNYGAMVALQQLNNTNSQLETTQTRINTGMKVASAKDNGAIFAIAQGMRSDVAGFGVVKESIDRTSSTVDVAIAAGEAVGDLLIDMKEKALGAADGSLTTSQRAAFNEDFKALRDQIGTIVSNAEFNGVNLINNSTAGVEALADADGGSTITVADENLSLGGGVVTLAATASLDTVTNASAAVGTIETSLDNLNQALARLGTASKALGIHGDFVQKLSDVTEKGIGNLVDADLAKESAKLQALQTKQQLGVQALSIANSSAGIALSFFR